MRMKFSKLVHFRQFLSLLLLLLIPLSVQSLVTTQSYGLLYEISKGGQKVGYLFGTMHSDDPRVLSLMNEIEPAMAESGRIVLELVPDDATMAEAAVGMMLHDGRNLQQIVGEDLYSELLPVVAERGVPEVVMQRFKPWALAILLSMPQKSSADFLDKRIFEVAQGKGIPVYGLESAAEQLSVFDSMSEIMQVNLLRDVVQYHDQTAEFLEQMIEAYMARDLVQLKAMSLQQEAGADEYMRAWFQRSVVEKRNLLMADRAEKYLSRGKTFIAVGALHLPGDRGLVHIFRQSGYEIVPIY